MNHLSVADAESWIRYAMELAERGRGAVEPNPLVGCVIIKDGVNIGEGWHQKFGGPHAEICALQNCQDQNQDPRGSTAVVTLEPCCHTGKTPPCTDALINAGIKEVIIGIGDPFPSVDGGGIKQLEDAGIQVTTGFLQRPLRRQNTGFLTRSEKQRPAVIAKWAMSLDGQIAVKNGSSQWISGAASRQKVHQIRGRVDAIIVGSGTAAADNPQLTARPSGPRIQTRIVFDSKATLAQDSKLAQTARSQPVMLIVHPDADSKRCEQLADMGIELYYCNSGYADRISVVLRELYQRGMTNVLLEGGGGLTGEFLSADCIDEVYAFIAPRMLGEGIRPLSGIDFLAVDQAPRLSDIEFHQFEDDLLVRGFLDRASSETD